MPTSPATRLPSNPRDEIESLLRIEPRFRPVIERCGRFPLPSRTCDFDLFVSSVVGQSISTKAASRILERIRESIAAKSKVSADEVLSQSPRKLRALGLSQSKANAVRELARIWSDQDLNSRKLARRSDAQLIDLFTQVKGIGPWTVKMILIFGLRRSDVFAEEDLGLRQGIQYVLDLDEPPPAKAARELADTWTPHRTVASIYLWQAVHQARNESLSSAGSWWRRPT